MTMTAPETIADPEMLDLDQYRERVGLSYDELATAIGVGTASQARRYALGERWPPPEVIDRILDVSCGAVTLHALHQRRAKWMRAHGRPRRVPVVRHPAE